MFDRTKNGNFDNGAPPQPQPHQQPQQQQQWPAPHATAVQEPAAATRTTPPPPVRGGDGAYAPTEHRRDHAHDARARQHEEYGGINWGSSFFGWLVAVGMAALLTGLLSAAGAATGLIEGEDAETISLAGGIALLVVMGLAYFCGGYVAGRMSRFDGARQGFGVWIVGLVVAAVVTILALALGSEYNVLDRAELPRLPMDGETLTTGGIIAMVAILAVTLLSAIAGGKVGRRYHAKVDRAGLRD